MCLCAVLVHTEDLTLGFIRLNSLPAAHAVEIKNGQEYILCFNSESTYDRRMSSCWKYMNLYLMIFVVLSLVVGMYMNGQGCHSRKQEILWHSPPASIGNIHTCVLTCNIHTYIHTYITYIHTHIHTYTHTYIHTYIHTCIHKYINIHTYTYIQSEHVFVCAAVYKEPYIMVYCESALEVYDVNTTKWIQTIPFRKVRYYF